jgi:hypothetical protein
MTSSDPIITIMTIVRSPVVPDGAQSTLGTHWLLKLFKERLIALHTHIAFPPITTPEANMATTRCIQQLFLAAVTCLLAVSPLRTVAEGLPVQFGLLPLGDLTTSDQDGPYAIPDIQAFEVRFL